MIGAEQSSRRQPFIKVLLPIVTGTSGAQVRVRPVWPVNIWKCSSLSIAVTLWASGANAEWLASLADICRPDRRLSGEEVEPIINLRVEDPEAGRRGTPAALKACAPQVCRIAEILTAGSTLPAVAHLLAVKRVSACGRTRWARCRQFFAVNGGKFGIAR